MDTVRPQGERVNTDLEELVGGLTAAEQALARDARQKGLSDNSWHLLDHFPEIDDIYKTTLTPPPGIVGEFIAANGKASKRPFPKFTTAATLATLSAIVGRKYKIRGGGLALNFIVAADSGTGKSQAIAAWEDFCEKASEAACHGLDKDGIPPLVHMHSAASIQAMMPSFEASPAAVWAVDECGNLLKSMSQAQTNTDHALRDSYNMLWDRSRHNARFSPPASIRSQKAGEKSINNINIST